MGTGDPGQCCSVKGKSTHELYCQNCRPQDRSIPPPSPTRPRPTVLVSLSDLTSLWRKRQLFRRLAELPRQQVTSPYSCMIFIISHMAEGRREAQESGGQSPGQVLAETHRSKGQEQ